MYVEFGLDKLSRKLKKQQKSNLLIETFIEFLGVSQAIKRKLSKIEQNCFTFFPMIKQNNHRGETSFDCFGRVREIGPPFSAEASCQVDAFPGRNGAFTFDLTNVER